MSTDNTTKNPFYLGASGSDLRYTKNVNLKLSSLWILCLKDNLSHETKQQVKSALYDRNSVINTSYQYLAIVEMDNNMLSNNNIRNGLIQIDRVHLPFDNITKDDNIVFLMIEYDESFIRSMIKSNKEKNLTELVQIKQFSRYVNATNTQAKLASTLTTLCDFDHWTKFNNCRIPDGNGTKHRVAMDGTTPTYKKLCAFVHKATRIDFRDHSNSYDDDIVYEKTGPYVRCLREEDIVTTLDDVKQILLGNMFSYEEKTTIVRNLMISAKYCHYLLDPELDDLLQSILRENPNLSRYLWSYMWTILCREQQKVYNMDNTTKRCLLSINQANNLPNFNVDLNKQYLNPYIVNILKRKKDGIKPVLRYGIINAICSQEEMTRRINLFLAGDIKNYLEGLDWSKCAITGSAMAAIIPFMSPLMFNVGMDKEQPYPWYCLLTKYFDKYYGNADMDLVCQFDTREEFIKHVIHVKNVLEKNTGRDDIRISTVKTISVNITKETINKLCESGHIPFTKEYFYDNKTSDRVKLFFYELYIKEKLGKNPKNMVILGDKINVAPYTDLITYGTLNDVFIKIYAKDYTNTETYDADGLDFIHCITMGEGSFVIKELFRHKVSSKGFKDVEIFNCRSINNTVMNFHLPCVRAYYKKDDTTISTMAVTAYLTGYNCDFNYCAASRTPFEIIFKYHNRGYGVDIDPNELKLYREFVDIHPDMKGKYKTEANYGMMCRNNPFYGCPNEYALLSEAKLNSPSHYEETEAIGGKHISFVAHNRIKGYLNPITETMISSF